MTKEVKPAKPYKKDNFTFGGIFSKSWKEYKENFWSIFKFVFLLVGIPSLILLLVHIVMMSADPNLFAILSNPASAASDASAAGTTVQFPLYYNIVGYFFEIVGLFLAVFMSAGIIRTLLKTKKSRFSFSELVQNARVRYWGFFGFSIVTFIFIVLLTLLLIIPGIIFGIYWVFAAYIFLDKNERIRPSLKQSRMIVRHRWWKTFGYLILLGIILLAFIIVINLLGLPVGIITVLKTLSGSSFSLGFLIISSVMNFITGFLGSVITPLGLFFLKNLYLEMKK